MDRDDPPPAYHELMPMIGEKSRSRSPSPRPHYADEFQPIVPPAPASAPTIPSNEFDPNDPPGIPTLDDVMVDFPNTFSIHHNPANESKVGS